MNAETPANTTRKVNLLIVVAGLGIGGAEMVIQHLVRTLDRTRFDVKVCCIKTLGTIGEQLASDGFDVFAISDPNAKRVDYFTFAKLLKVIRKHKIDILHSHSRDALADAAVCRLLTPRVKLVHTFHFGNYPNLSRRLMRFERIFSKLATRLIAVGEVQRQQLKSVHGFPDHRIGRVWNGVARHSSNDGRAFRARLAIGNKVLVGTIATLIEQKGLRDLLAVAKKLRDDSDKFAFVVVGEGHMRTELEAMCRDLGLEDTVIFAGWVPGAADVALPAFDIFFQPSLWEAMSIAILEAMAAAKPVVATTVGENPHVITDGVDGLLVSPGDVDLMAHALRKLIDDPALRARLGHSAVEKVAHQFTVEHMTRAYESIYLDVLSRARSS